MRSPVTSSNAPISLVTNTNGVEFEYGSLDEAFPDVDPGIVPHADRVLVQVRMPKLKTKGGLHLITETRSTEYYNTQVAKVIALGPLCFKSSHRSENDKGEVREVLVDWAEGKWFDVGNFVRIPKMGGDRFTQVFESIVPVFDAGPGEMRDSRVPEEVVFVIHRVRDILGRITGDPLKFKAFLD